MKTHHRAAKRGFTLIELLVVVAIIALLISILLPSLRKAREQTKAVVCLSNLRSIGQGIFLYVSNYQTLPGPLHPALYRNQGLDYLMDNPIVSFSLANAQYQQSRFLTFKLKAVYNDTSSQKDTMTDSVTTCPTLAGIVPDEWFVKYSRANPSRYCFPTHYVINNPAPFDEETADPGAGRRVTNPPMYFGYSPPTYPSSWSAWERQQMALYPPKPIEQVKDPGREWAVADAWYRKKIGATPSLSQEGPYQYDWSGTGMINYAPHNAFLGTFDILSTDERSSSNEQIRRSRQDGKTNTLYFDSHAEAVASKVLRNGRWELMYGFPGTVNPLTPLPPQAGWE